MTDEPFEWKKLAVPVYGPSLLFGLGEGAILPVIALSARDLGATVALAALVVTLVGIGSLVANIPASIITARFGERWCIVAASLWCALAMGLCVLASELWVFAAGIFLIGTAAAVFNLARQSYLTDVVPVHMRARALSTLGGTMRIGVFIGPFMGAAAIHFIGLDGAYWVGAVALLAAGGIAIGMRELPRHTPARTADTIVPTIMSITRSHVRIFTTVGIGVVLVAAVRASRQVVLPLWADSLGLDASTTSLIYGLSGAADMLLFYPAGKVMDQRGRMWVAVPSMALMGAALILLPFTTGVGTLTGVALLIGFGNGIGSGMIMTLGADYSPSPGRPQFLGLWRLLADIGSSGGPSLLAGMTALISLSAGIWFIGAASLVAAAVLGYWIPRTGPLTPEPVTSGGP